MIRIELPMGPILDPPKMNVYLLQGEPLTMVDTGFATDAAWEALNHQLENNQLTVRDIKQVILTHAHGDHYGLAARIGRNSEATIISHSRAKPRFIFEKQDWERGNRFLFETLSRTGAPRDPLARRLTQTMDGDPLVEPVRVDFTVREGDPVTDGDEVWEVIELPGHAPGIIGLYRKETRELIASDTLLRKTNSRPVLYMPENSRKHRYRYMADYMKSLEKILELNPTVVWPAHGERIDDVKGTILFWINKHRAQANMFVETLKDGDKTAYEVWKAVFPKVLPFDPVKGLIEVISYLDLPVVEGSVEIYEHEDKDYYRLFQ